MLTGKQRAKLRAMANGLDSILQVGKGGMGNNLIQQANEAITSRELIKCNVLETCELSAREIAIALSAGIGAEIIQVIGSRFVLYRENKEDKKIKIN